MPAIKKDLDIKKIAFTMDELKTALKNTKYGKSCGLNNMLGDIWKINDFSDILLWYTLETQLNNGDKDVYYPTPPSWNHLNISSG